MQLRSRSRTIVWWCPSLQKIGTALSGSDGSWCGDPDPDRLVGNGEGAAIVSVGVVIGLKGK